MADTFYGVNIGAGLDESGVTVDTSTTSKKIELRVEQAVSGMNKTELLKAIEAIKAYVVQADAPA